MIIACPGFIKTSFICLKALVSALGVIIMEAKLVIWESIELVWLTTCPMSFIFFSYPLRMISSSWLVKSFFFIRKST